MLDKALKLVALGLVNRLLGMLFGLFKYALILSFLVYFFENINRKFDLVSPEYKSNSLLFEPIQIASKPFSQLLNSFST
jgi:membrane protein required for colicin V production